MIDEKRTKISIGESLKNTAPYLGLGSQLAATIIVLFFIGRWLDDKIDSSPAMTILFSFIGGAAGIYNFIKTVLNLNRKKEE